jgi:pilus assembly protein CpaB
MPLPLIQLLRRLDRWPRRLAALGCLLLAAASAVAARSSDSAPARGQPEQTRLVVVAARALGAAHPLARRDLAIAAWPRRLVPTGAHSLPSELVGRRLAGPIGAGEAVTTARLVGAGLTAGLPPGAVAAAVRTDADVASFIRPGDHVDVLAGPADENAPLGSPDEPPAAGSQAVAVAQAVAVLAVLPPTNAAANTDTTQVIIATDRGTALRLAALPGRQVLAVVADPP